MDATPSTTSYEELSLWNKSLVRIAFALLGSISVFAFVIIVVNLSFFLLDAFDAIRGNYRFFIPSRSIFSLFVGLFFGFFKAPEIYSWVLPKYQENQIFRYFILCSSFYIICVMSFVQLFEPKPFRKGLAVFGDVVRYDDEILLLMKLVLYPISMLAIGLYLYSKRYVGGSVDKDGGV